MKRRPGAACVGTLIVAFAAACFVDASGQIEGDSTTASGSTSSTEATGGSSTGGQVEPEPEYEVELDGATDTLRLLRDGDPLLRFEVDAFAWGVVEAIDDAASYNPMHELPVAWQSATEAELLQEQPLRVRLTFQGGGHARLHVDEEAAGRFSAALVPEPDAPVLAAYRIAPRVDAREGFYGLGEWFDTPNHRGKDRPMQLEADLSLETSNNEVHVPIPFLIGTTGWGLFVEDPHAGRFEVATRADDEVRITFGTGPDSPDGLRFHLFAAQHPLDVTRHYHAVTGAPARVAPWALGPWIWRNENTDQAQVEQDAQTLRDLDLATSGLWIDRPYASGVNTFDFDPARYPDPQSMIDRLHDLGLAVALWHTPYLSDGPEPALQLRAEAEARGFFPPVSGPRLNGWSEPVDLTDPEAYAWWQGLIARYTDMGIEGFKLDYAEDVLAGVGGQRTPWSFDDGSDERTMQALYQLFYHRVYAQMLPEDGGFLLCRAGTYGDQVNVGVIWPGDLDADFNLHREQVDGEARVGGLPAAVVAGSSLGPSGFPLFASDTGGYRHSPPDKELMTRWFQHTALTPVMQIGTGSSDVAWEATPDNGFDEQMLQWYREFTRLHLRLFPYLWTHVLAVYEHGRAVQRPVGLAYPELGEHPAYDYLLGDDLLVAPVVQRGQSTRDVVFPPGRWVDWFDGSVVQGPGTVEVPAPLSKLPLFVRAGGIVPLLRPSIDTLRPVAGGKDIDSFATDPGILYPRVVPGPASELVLYDGTIIAQSLHETELSLSFTEGSTFTRGALFELLAVEAAPGSVRLGGLELPMRPLGELETAAAGWAWSSGSVWIRVPAGTHSVTVTW